MPKIKEPEEEEEEEDVKKEDAVGRLRKPKKHKFEKEDEDEEEDEEACKKKAKKEDADEDEDESMGEEGVRYKKKKKVKKEDEDEDDEEEEEETEKAGLEMNPEESATSSTTAEHTTTPGKMTGKPQNVFVPSTNIPGSRIASGTTPGKESYSGKSINPDLMKSPLFVELSGQLDEFQKAFDKKLGSVSKSFTDRIDNLQKTFEKIEQFYKQPFYKAASENVGPEGVPAKSISKQIEEGKIRYSG